LGKTLASDGGDPRERIRHAFRACMTREPDDEELDALVALYTDQLEQFGAAPDEAQAFIKNFETDGVEPHESAAYIAVARAIMNLDEFVTRE